MDRKKIVYVGNFDFPFGNAAGKRVYGNGKLIRAVGYEPLFVGMSRKVANIGSIQETEREYDGFKYYCYPYPGSLKEWIHYRQALKKFIRWMADKKDSTYAIICYCSLRLSCFITGLCRWARKNNILVISDCTDWLESRTGNLLFDLAKTADTLYQKVIANRRVDGVICISSYLAGYYSRAGKKTLVLPPLSTECVTHTAEVKENRPEDKLKLLYTGIPSFKVGSEIRRPAVLKDRIDTMIDLLKYLKQENVDFCFYYYGLDKEDFITALPAYAETISYLGDNICFCGLKENEEVVRKIKEADFTVLMRDVKRSTMAGFPTKVSESISCGTPAITTRTSDIDRYLTENKNVVFVNQSNLREAAQRIKHLIQEKQHIRMKEYCAGNVIFYFQSYIEEMKNFLATL